MSNIFRLADHDDRQVRPSNPEGGEGGSSAPGSLAIVLQQINGHAFDPDNPSFDHLGLPEFARVLSNQCRFGGHSIDFYSVAQHSVLVAALAPGDDHHQKWALLHDADEACSLPDIPTPVKPLFPELVAYQKRFGSMIAEKYDLDPQEPLEVKHADRQALALERSYCMHQPSGGPIIACDVAAPNGISIDPLSPRESRALMEDAFARVFDMGKPIDMAWLSEQPGFRVSSDLVNKAIAERGSESRPEP